MLSVSRAASLALLAALCACAQPPSTSDAAPEAAVERPAAATRAGAPASQVLADIQWPGEGRLDRQALSALPQAAARAAAASRVPVLVPSRRELLAAPVIVTRENWTSFWARTPEITVSLKITRLAHKYPGLAPMRGPRDIRGAPAFVTANEGIWSATWMENGVSYALDLECASPDAPACASDALLLELASELVYVGGVGHGQAPAGGDK
jgi:hypothetical protein